MVNYVRTSRRLAQTDTVISNIIKEAALIEDRKVINTHAFDKLLIDLTLFEANMKTIMRELEKFKQ